MEEVQLGKIEKDEKILDWPKDREVQVKEIIEEMSKPITKEFMDSILSAPMAKCKSDSLFKMTLELGLTLNCIPDDINVLFIAQDINTKEGTHLLLAPQAKDESQKMGELINTLNNECIGTRTEDGQTVANEIFTIIANVCAQYCASNPQYKEAFLKVIDYWTEVLKNNEANKEKE
jgi:hypothetical protein